MIDGSVPNGAIMTKAVISDYLTEAGSTRA
jgi:hypothetical protein